MWKTCCHLHQQLGQRDGLAVLLYCPHSLLLTPVAVLVQEVAISAASIVLVSSKPSGP